MARPSSKDPLDRFRWAVEIEGFTRSGFTACDVPSYQIQTKSYPEGGQHLAPLQIVDTISYKPVTLTRGVSKDLDFDGWAKQAIELVNGKTEVIETKQEQLVFQNPVEIPLELGGGVVPGQFSKEPAEYADFPVAYRRTVVITHLNRKGDKVKIYTLYNAFPIEYEPASSFASDGDDVLSMEKLVLAYESFDVKSISKDTNPFDVRDITKRLINRSF